MQDMCKPLVYADFQNADALGRLRLNCSGSLDDLARQQVQLREGLQLALYSDDADEHGEPDELRVEGIAQYSQDDRCWVAVIDRNSIHHASDEKGDGNGAGQAIHPVSGQATY
jgi:hypothetical protein